MKHSFRNVLERVIHKADIIIEVVDARLIEETRNQDIEQMVAKHNKALLIVINKADLVSQEVVEQAKKNLPNAVFVSGKLHMGTTKLREAIYKTAKSNTITVGVVGYPNTGKSTVINSLKGKEAAPVSSKSGHTRGEQRIRVSKRIQLLDTPGVIPIEEKDQVRLALLGVKNPDRLKDPDLAAMKILEFILDQGGTEQLEKTFQITITDEPLEEILEMIAVARNRKTKGGEPDVMTVSKQIIKEWQKGSLVSFRT